MIKVDETSCIGCGACVAVAPENFEFDEKGLSKPIEGAAVTDATREAVSSCPVGAISVDEGATPAENNEPSSAE